MSDQHQIVLPNEPTTMLEVPEPIQTPKPRQSKLLKLLSRRSGASIEQIQKAMKWQPHSVRAAISKHRKAGHAIERYEGRIGSRYRVVAEVNRQIEIEVVAQ